MITPGLNNSDRVSNPVRVYGVRSTCFAQFVLLI